MAKDVRWIENLEGSREGEEEARVTFEEAVAKSAGGASVSESEPDESSAGEEGQGTGGDEEEWPLAAMDQEVEWLPRAERNSPRPSGGGASSSGP